MVLDIHGIGHVFLALEVVASIEQRNDDEILLWGISSKSIIHVLHTVKRLNTILIRIVTLLVKPPLSWFRILVG